MAGLPSLGAIDVDERTVASSVMAHVSTPGCSDGRATLGLPHTRPRRAVRNVRNMTPISGFRFRHPAEESNPVLQNRSLPCCPAHSQGGLVLGPLSVVQ